MKVSKSRNKMLSNEIKVLVICSKQPQTFPMKKILWAQQISRTCSCSRGSQHSHDASFRRSKGKFSHHHKFKLETESERALWWQGVIWEGFSWMGQQGEAWLTCLSTRVIVWLQAFTVSHVTGHGWPSLQCIPIWPITNSHYNHMVWV